MRDNHEGMPEILDAIERDGYGFCLIQLEMEGRQRRFRFGVTLEGYMALKRVLQLRPFDHMPGTRHRYFFAFGSRLNDDRATMDVRIEQGRVGKQFCVEAPKELVANLMWFHQLKDWSKAEPWADSE